MRDKNRIPILLNKLQELWQMYPDYRFGQLISNIADSSIDIFFPEDDKWLEWIENYKSVYGGLKTNIELEEYHPTSEKAKIMFEKLTKIKEAREKFRNNIINNVKSIFKKHYSEILTELDEVLDSNYIDLNISINSTAHQFKFKLG